MALSNKQKAAEYYERCKRFIKNKLAEGTLPFSAEGKVVRSELYRAINVNRAVINQNPRIKRLLRATERLARMKGTISATTPSKAGGAGKVSGTNDPYIIQMQARLNFLEKQVAALMVENRELRKAAKRSEWIDNFLNDPDSRQGALPW
jgi:hypothetical protein